jgi:hypothetical protein
VTRGQFFLALQDAIRTHPQGAWSCHTDGLLTPIRLAVATRDYCPITFVAEACGYGLFNLGQVYSASVALGLNRRVALQIQRAADASENSRTRIQLLACCGLTEDTDHA